MKRSKKAIIAFTLCLIIAISICAVAFAAEPRWVVDCPECKRGTIIETSTQTLYGLWCAACSHYTHGNDYYAIYEVCPYSYCNNCGYTSYGTPQKIYSNELYRCDGYNA